MINIVSKDIKIKTVPQIEYTGNKICGNTEQSGCSGGYPRHCGIACAQLVRKVLLHDCSSLATQPTIAQSLRPLAQICKVPFSGIEGGH